MDKKPQIEVELRAMFDEAKFKELAELLSKKANDLGEDDKNVFFFILPDKLVKVVDNVSKNTAKIVMKLTKIGEGSGFEEIEVPIERSDVKKAVRIFTALGLDEIQESFQKRHNFLYKDIELALKYSDTWGHHLELEIVVDNEDAIASAEKKIKDVASELDVLIMSDEELKEFTRRKDKEYRKRKE